MKIKLLILLLMISGYAVAQKLNKFGHLVFDKPVVSADNFFQLLPANLRSIENSVIRISNGYLVIESSCGGSRNTFHIFNSRGVEIFSKTFSHTINLAFSPNKSYCIFHDLSKIHKIDLLNFKEEKFEGSNIFSINDSGEILSYNEKNSSINFKSHSLQVNEPVYRTFFYKDIPFFITRNCVFEFQDNKYQGVFCTADGRIFDIGEFKDKLFISVKTEKKGEFVFKLYSSNNLVNFIPGEEVHFPLISSVAKIRNHTQSSVVNSAAGELIRDPLNFYSDSVYQPIGNSYNEIQDYGSPPYLHPGVDLLGNLLEDVHSVKKGYVKAIITTNSTAHWRIAISNENISGQSTGYLYAHIDSTTFPYVVGDSVNEGDIVGQLVNFGVTGFNHCHFARITDTGSTWYGAWWVYDNPLSYMTNVFDTIPPVFEKTINNDEFAFRDLNGIYLSPDSLYGSLKVISKFYDIINSSWHVDVNRISYNLSSAISPNVLILDSFAFDYKYFNDVYPGTSYNTDVLNTIYSRDFTCFSVGNYNIRDFFHIVTNSDGNDTITTADSIQVFNTLNFPDGYYIFRIIAVDPFGNSTTDSMIIGIKNHLTSIDKASRNNNINVFPNPSSDGKFIVSSDGFENNSEYEVYNDVGEKIISGKIQKQSSSFDIDIPGSGIFFLRIFSGEKIFIKYILRL